MKHQGLIAIVRGVTPGEAGDIGKAIVQAGFTTIEVPLNSPSPFESIKVLRDELPAEISVGAGTVLDVDSVRRAYEVGSDVIVAPNTDSEVISAACDLGMTPFPGVATATEAFAAIKAGAHLLKVFPADERALVLAKAWKAVLPPEIGLIPVGGVGEDNFSQWIRLGAVGAGIGSALYCQGDSATAVAKRAKSLARAWQQAMQDAQAS